MLLEITHANPVKRLSIHHLRLCEFIESKRKMNGAQQQLWSLLSRDEEKFPEESQGPRAMPDKTNVHHSR